MVAVRINRKRKCTWLTEFGGSDVNTRARQTSSDAGHRQNTQFVDGERQKAAHRELGPQHVHRLAPLNLLAIPAGGVLGAKLDDVWRYWLDVARVPADADGVSWHVSDDDTRRRVRQRWRRIWPRMPIPFHSSHSLFFAVLCSKIETYIHLYS